MRKRNLSYLIDKLFWTLVLITPLLFYTFYMLSYRFTDDTMQVVGFADYIINTFGINTSGDVYVAFLDIFSSADFLGVLNSGNNSLVLYMVYMFIVELIHVVYDVLVFIPRFAHKVVEKMTEESYD